MSDNHVAGIVPISYSHHSGLESAVWRAKNSPSHRWLNYALASILSDFLSMHCACIERQFGRVDAYTILPSHPDARGGWDHNLDML